MFVSKILNEIFTQYFKCPIFMSSGNGSDTYFFILSATGKVWPFALDRWLCKGKNRKQVIRFSRIAVFIVAAVDRRLCWWNKIGRPWVDHVGGEEGEINKINFQDFCTLVWLSKGRAILNFKNIYKLTYKIKTFYFNYSTIHCSAPCPVQGPYFLSTKFVSKQLSFSHTRSSTPGGWSSSWLP